MQKSVFFILFITSFILKAQNSSLVYSLDDCINIALKNNLDLKSASLRVETSDVNFRQSKNALLPSLNGNYNIGQSDGRSIDPFTNSYINENLTFSNAGLRLDAIVFNGFQLINRWRQDKLNLMASEMEKEDQKYNLILNVTLAYLQVMNAKDLYALAEHRITATTDQVNRLKIMYEEEEGNPSDYRDFQGLRANDEANLIGTKNDFEAAKLRLKQQLNIQEDFDISGIDVPIEFSRPNETYQEVYAEAIVNMAIVKAGELRLEASERGVAVAKSNYAPEISLFANLNTNYSSAARVFDATGTSVVDTGDFVSISGQDYPVFSEQTSFTESTIGYQDQFENNINTTAGIAVNIPLFNGFFAKNRVALEKIKMEEASVQLDRIKLDLRTIIEQTYNDMAAAYKRYLALKEQNDAYAESLRINEIRFNNGVDNSVSFIISKNNLENALINLNNVKYEFVLRMKLLDYFKGGTQDY